MWWRWCVMWSRTLKPLKTRNLASRSALYKSVRARVFELGLPIKMVLARMSVQARNEGAGVVSGTVGPISLQRW